MVMPSLQTMGFPHFFWMRTHLDLGPRVMRTASVSAVAPLSTFSRATDRNSNLFAAISYSSPAAGRFASTVGCLNRHLRLNACDFERIAVEMIRRATVMRISFGFSTASRSDERRHAAIVKLSSTWQTPGAAQAARSASLRSAHERTLPRRTTLFPLTSTLMRVASSSVVRRNAFSIFVFTSEELIAGCFTVIRLIRPFTPVRYRTASSAHVCWNLEFTVPSNVTQPFTTLTLMVSRGTQMCHFSAFSTA